MQPEVSIIVPTFNRAELTRRAVTSALGQTCRDIEVVAVDNASGDGTWEVLQELAAGDRRVRCSRNERNLGPVGNWARGLELARAEYVQLLFSDDWLEPDAVERLLRLMRGRRRVGFAYGAARLHRAAEPPRVRYARSRSGALASGRFLWDYATGTNVPVSPCGVIMRRGDALEALERGPLPIPDGRACFERGIGIDALLMWHLCAAYDLVAHECEPLVNLEYGSTQAGSPGITLAMVTEGKQDALMQGYAHSFGYFLGVDDLSEPVRRRLASGWFVRRTRLRELLSRRAWREHLEWLSPRLQMRRRLLDPWVAGLLGGRLVEWLGYRSRQLRGLVSRGFAR